MSDEMVEGIGSVFFMPVEFAFGSEFMFQLAVKSATHLLQGGHVEEMLEEIVPPGGAIKVGDGNVTHVMLLAKLFLLLFKIGDELTLSVTLIRLGQIAIDHVLPAFVNRLDVETTVSDLPIVKSFFSYSWDH